MSFRSHSYPLLALAAGLLVAGSIGCSKGGPKAPSTPMEIQTERMVRSEALNLSWSKTGFRKKLGQAIEGKRFPGPLCDHYFADKFEFQGVVEEYPEYDKHMNEGTAAVRNWEISPEVVTVSKNGDGDVAYEDLDLYRSLFDNVEYFKYAKVKVHLPVPEWVDPETMHKWKVSMKFDGKALMKNGRLATIKGFSEVIWEQDPDDYDTTNPDEQVWRVISWKVKSLKVTETDGWLFEEVLEEVIPDKESLELAQRSLHEGTVAEWLQAMRDGKKFNKPNPSWQVAAADRQPSVTVVDLDQDGWDDFYIQERQGRNLFFHNNGDGTFTETAKELGIDYEGRTSHSLFADFDNDGDLDAFIGGTLDRGRILEMVDGKLVDRSGEWIAEENLPFHTTSISVVDYDGDGLLDIYVSTYAARFIQVAINALVGGQKLPAARQKSLNALQPFLHDADWLVLKDKIKVAAEERTIHSDRPGPPNVLLKNMGGGRFEPATDAQEILLFYNTFQATFADYDNDGDPDVYIANDFAPNHLFRNDGDGKFTDMTDVMDVKDIGFGMGVTWGDYDNNGRQDLYVANMFSKAARRVTSFFTEGRVNYDAALLGGEGIDPVIETLGHGNSLFKNDSDDGLWEKVSAEGKVLHNVEAAGWCWGTQFADFNNDGWLDIYAPAGYYTAPKEKKVDVDL